MHQEIELTAPIINSQISLEYGNMEREFCTFLKELDSDMIQPGDTNGAIVLRFYQTYLHNKERPVPVMDLIRAGVVNGVLSLHEIFDLYPDGTRKSYNVSTSRCMGFLFQRALNSQTKESHHIHNFTSGGRDCRNNTYSAILHSCLVSDGG